MIKEICKNIVQIIKSIYDQTTEYELGEYVSTLFFVILLGYVIGIIIRLFKPLNKDLPRYYFKEEFKYQGFYNMKDRLNPLFNLKLCIMEESEYELYKYIYNNKLGLKKVS